jgi:hypothetical protein
VTRFNLFCTSSLVATVRRSMPIIQSILAILVGILGWSASLLLLVTGCREDAE